MSPAIIRNIVSLTLDEILPSPLNPRRHSHAQLTDAELRPLGESLASGGQWELITVRPHPTEPGRYELVNGERRWRAAKLVGVKSLEARVEAFTDAQALDMMLATGGQDEPLSPIALAYGYAERMALEGLTQEQLAKRLGVAIQEITRHIALLELPEEIKDAIDAGKLDMRTGYVVATVPGKEDREAFAKEVMHPVTQVEPLSVRAAEQLRAAKYCRTLRGAPFDLKDAQLVPEAGACSACPWNAGNNPETYGELDNSKKATCMRPACYDSKLAAVRVRVIEKHRKEGVEPLTPEENAQAYPRGDFGLNFRMPLVEWTKPVPADLLKPEVAAKGAPKWEEICNGDKAQVVVRLGFDQHNRPVKLVRVAEAVIAADENERAIFNEETRVRYGLAHQKGGTKPTTASERSAPKEAKETPPKAPAGPEKVVPFAKSQADDTDARVVALKAEAVALAELLRDVADSVWPHLAVALRIDVEAMLTRHGVKLASTQAPAAPTPDADPDVEKLRAEVEAAFVATALMAEDSRDRVCRVAAKGAKDWAHLNDLEQLKKVLKFLKSKKAPAPKTEREEEE